MEIETIVDSAVENDGQLIARARTDPRAFAALYRRHYDSIFRYCVHRLFERQSAEDITSTVFMKALGNFTSFSGRHDSDFRNWLYKIASNEINDHFRRTIRRKSIFESLNNAAEPQCSYQPSDDNAAVLQKAVLKLKPKYQTIITLRFFENLKLTEIAQVLDSSPGTVRSQLNRALNKLKTILPDNIWEVE